MNGRGFCLLFCGRKTWVLNLNAWSVCRQLDVDVQYFGRGKVQVDEKKRRELSWDNWKGTLVEATWVNMMEFQQNQLWCRSMGVYCRTREKEKHSFMEERLKHQVKRESQVPTQIQPKKPQKHKKTRKVFFIIQPSSVTSSTCM